MVDAILEVLYGQVLVLDRILYLILDLFHQFGLEG